MKENRITEDDTPEEVERKQLYATLCADKKPYFFQYNYSSLKTEYGTFIKNVRSNAISLYKKDLDLLIQEYNDNLLTDENEIKFMRDFYYKLPLDMSKGTMNRICWAIEKEFDGIDLFKDVYFDYTILKSDIAYNERTYDVIKYICQAYKPVVQLAKKRAVLNYDTDEEDDWHSVDIIIQNMVEELHSTCSNEEELCDILIDLCYRDGMPKQIFWTACGDTVINRLLRTHDYKMSYPKRSVGGEFWCQGIQYTMTEIKIKGGDIDEGIEI